MPTTPVAHGARKDSTSLPRSRSRAAAARRLNSIQRRSEQNTTFLLPLLPQQQQNLKGTFQQQFPRQYAMLQLLRDAIRCGGGRKG